MNWPNTTGAEVAFVSADSEENNATDPDGASGYTESRNITLAFIPSYQFRYAPGQTWSDSGFDDAWSWNYNITIFTEDGYFSYDNPTASEGINEFGVYTYSEIVSVGWPSIVGIPGRMAYTNDTGGSNNISMTTRTNGNYSLGVEVENLTHLTAPANTISNETIYTAGGDLSLTNFSFGSALYYYGGAATYRWARNDTTSMDTDPIQWAVDITLGQYPGDYNATIYYHLATQTG
jgi:hypothetical protein